MEESLWQCETGGKVSPLLAASTIEIQSNLFIVKLNYKLDFIYLKMTFNVFEQNIQ